MLSQSPAAAAAPLEDICHQHSEGSGAASAAAWSGYLGGSNQADIKSLASEQPCGAASGKARTDDGNPRGLSQFSAALGITSA